MAKPFANLLRRWRYGDEIVVVSGLPRSGTSMMMRMLDAGGMQIVSDGEREADDDNPRGYFELERVKDLEKDPDKSWLGDSRGRAIKVISHLLRELPDEHFYRVLFMRRDLHEVVASQNKMLQNRGEPNPVEDARAIELYRKHVVHTKVFLRERPNFALLEVEYRDALARPADVAARVASAVQQQLDVEKMSAAVDPSLYRNRREDLR